MEILDFIKTSQRITHNVLDDVLLADIQSGAEELMRVGVDPYVRNEADQYILDASGNKTIVDNALIIRAIDFWVKAVEDFEEKSDKYMKMFEKLRDSLAVSGDFNAKRTDYTDNNNQ